MRSHTRRPGKRAADCPHASHIPNWRLRRFQGAGFVGECCRGTDIK